MRRVIAIGLMAVFALAFTDNASARVFIGGGVVLGAPYAYYPPYYGYPYYMYAPPPAYGYAPPPGYPYPQPYAAQPPYPLPPPSAQDRYYSEDGDYCREYRHNVTIEGQRHQVFGHACRQPDGQWKIVD